MPGWPEQTRSARTLRQLSRTVALSTRMLFSAHTGRRIGSCARTKRPRRSFRRLKRPRRIGGRRTNAEVGAEKPAIAAYEEANAAADRAVQRQHRARRPLWGG